MDENETIDDIAEKIRQDGWEISGLLIPDDGGKTRAMLPGLADRIEVAWKRERAEAELYWSGIGHAEAVAEFKWGNMAATRKALEAARAALSSYADGGDEDNAETNAALAEIDAALAAPPRNCDQTLNEAVHARNDFCTTVDCVDCPYSRDRSGYDCVWSWLFDTAKQKGGKKQ